jgi:hypothetical protein
LPGGNRTFFIDVFAAGDFQEVSQREHLRINSARQIVSAVETLAILANCAWVGRNASPVLWRVIIMINSKTTLSTGCSTVSQAVTVDNALAAAEQ